MASNPGPSMQKSAIVAFGWIEPLLLQPAPFPHEVDGEPAVSLHVTAMGRFVPWSSHTMRSEIAPQFPLQSTLLNSSARAVDEVRTSIDAPIEMLRRLLLHRVIARFVCMFHPLGVRAQKRDPSAGVKRTA
jgi:hypothetical protein